MIPFIQLIRYKNLLMIAFTLYLTQYFLITPTKLDTASVLNFSLYVLSILVLTAIGYAFNDICDIKTDAINKPQKMIIGRFMTVKRGYFYLLILFLLGALLAFYVTQELNYPAILFLLLLPLLLLIVYSKFLKRIAIIGNLLISFCTAYLFFLVLSFNKSYISNLSVWDTFLDLFTISNTSLIVFLYALFAFLTTFIRELVKDIEDINGDYNSGMKTLPILVGVKRTRNVVIFFSFLLFVMLIITLKELFTYDKIFLSVYTLVLLLFPIGYFIYLLWNFERKNEFSFASSYLKFYMFLGILSMILF